MIWDTPQHNTRTSSPCQVAQLKYLTVCQFPEQVLGNLQISTGVTLRENNLKEIEGGKILESEGVLVANKQALKRDSRLLTVVHELIERFEVRSSRKSWSDVTDNCTVLQLRLSSAGLDCQDGMGWSGLLQMPFICPYHPITAAYKMLFPHRVTDKGGCFTRLI